ncbi:hypothetical protein C2E23DRAFT_882467 [Lenzites betulinus]|nr:hypothetical protein C2E23DRAFT_882458 [Lenzites betulinus]KAH9856403.1 hypothetical protein C2E23DRAFT_882467 [Lenzites betulinus]
MLSQPPLLTFNGPGSWLCQPPGGVGQDVRALPSTLRSSWILQEPISTYPSSEQIQGTKASTDASLTIDRNPPSNVHATLYRDTRVPGRSPQPHGVYDSGYDAEMEEDEDEDEEDGEGEGEGEENDGEGDGKEAKEGTHQAFVDPSTAPMALKELLLRLKAIEDKQDQTGLQIARIWEELKSSARRNTRPAMNYSENEYTDGFSEPSPQDRRSDAEGGQRGKDSRGNYLRGCVRKHVGNTFGITAGGGIPPSPPNHSEQTEILKRFAAGHALSKPFLYDWSSPPSTTYNECIEEAFCADFWLCVAGGAHLFEAPTLDDFE